jgi:hypothetical protein
MNYAPPPIDHQALLGNGYLPAPPAWIDPFQINWLSVIFRYIVPIIAALALIFYLKERYDQMQHLKRYNPQQAQYYRW